MAESPFALSGYYPSRSRLQAAWAGVTRPSSLLRTHAPDRDAPWAFALARSLGLRRLLRAPAANRPFPTLSLQSLPRCLDPYPAAISRCTCSFLPGRRRPHLTKDRFGSPDNPCMATSTGGLISGLQSFTHVQAPRLARPPGCSRRFLRRAARPFTPRISRLVTCPELRYRYVCERTIHTAGLSPAGLQPCRLLPFAGLPSQGAIGVWTAARSCSAVLHTCLMAESDSEIQVGPRVATPLGEVNNTSLEKHQAHTMWVRHSTGACPSIAERKWESKSPKRAKTTTGRSLRIFRWPPTCSKPGPKKPSPSRISTTR